MVDIQPVQQNLILDAAYGKAVVDRYLRTQIDVASDVREYGSLLVVRAFESSPKGLREIVAIPVLLRHVLAMFDATLLCLENGAVYASDVPLRAMLEGNLALAWLTKVGTELELRVFYVATLRAERSWVKQLIPGTPEFAAAHRLDAGSRGTLSHATPKMIEEARDRMREITAFLARRSWRDTNSRFCFTSRGKKRKLRPGRDLPWYKVGRPGSYRTMAKDLGREDEAHNLYRSLSYTTHALRIKAQAALDGNVVRFEPIRGVEGFKQAFTMALNLAFGTYRRILEDYRPDEVERFSQVYVDRWRAAFMSIPDIHIETEDAP